MWFVINLIPIMTLNSLILLAGISPRSWLFWAIVGAAFVWRLTGYLEGRADEKAEAAGRVAEVGGSIP